MQDPSFGIHTDGKTGTLSLQEAEKTGNSELTVSDDDCLDARNDTLERFGDELLDDQILAQFRLALKVTREDPPVDG
jgi:hypothetical protein